VLDLAHQPLVFEHQRVRVEYISVLAAKLAGEPRFDFAKLRAGLLDRFAQPFDFGSDLAGRYDYVIKLMPPALIEPEHLTYGDAGRGGKTAHP
jgi:hypothetical protein